MYSKLGRNFFPHNLNAATWQLVSRGQTLPPTPRNGNAANASYNTSCCIVYGQGQPIIIYAELHDALMIIIERNLSPDFHSKTDNAVRRGGAA